MSEKKEKSLNSTLIEIQSELKAPKNQTNKFGGYKYRSCEDILEAVKPLLKKHNLSLRITDEIVMLGDRYYVKATAHLRGDNDVVSVDGYAREALNKKGMDESQITGACSSYARKYALNGLFLIDDTKDADSTNKHGKDEKPAVKQEVKKEIVLSMIAAEFLTGFETVGDLKELKDYAGKIKDKIADLPESERKYLQDQYILIAKKLVK